MGDTDKGGWGYVVVAGSHLDQMLLMGTAGSLSVVFSEWAYEFNTSIGSASMVLGIVPIIVGLFSPVAAALIGRFGCRPIAFIGGTIAVSALILSTYVQSLEQLYYSFVMLSIGASMSYAPSILVLGEYFKKRIVLANAISFVGISTGQLIIPPFLSFLFLIYGWRGGLFILGALYMHLFVSAAIFRPNRRRNAMKNPEHVFKGSQNLADGGSQHLADDSSNFGDTKPSICAKLSKAFGIPALCINPHFVLTILTLTIYSIASFGAITFLIPRSENAGIQKDKSALLMSCYGIGGMVGRIGHGILIDRGYITTASFFVIAIVTCSIEIFLIPILDNYAFLVCLSLLFGISSGIISSLCMVMPREVVGSTPDLVTPAIGLSMLATTGGQSIGVLLSAIIYNTMGRYSTVYYVLGGLSTLSALIFFPTYLTLRRREMEDRSCREKANKNNARDISL
ncbi:monocarboxylate transporter 12-like [Amphiura filiformis]|uniref:monocarboxylate transporter 12-like n=1 Tax=Amphiura filiformis TaxID=82378 RepID=UPI003B222018